MVHLGIVILLKRLLELACDLLEEADLLLEVMLHLGLEVPHSSLVEVLDLSHCGERDDVAAFPDAVCLQAFHLPFLYVLLAFLHLRQSTCGESRTGVRLNIDSDSVKREVMTNSSTG